MGILYLVATPIGNLEDITLRALRILGQVGLIAAEDTRTTRRLLAHYGLKATLTSYHEHNKKAKIPFLLQALQEKDVALVSEAGMPGLSDPGWELVAAAAAQGIRVEPIPGPSAPVAALAVSGLPSREFLFLGFLPRRKGARRRLLASLASEPRTLVFLEAPHRLRASLEDLDWALGERRLAVCRELTKLYEEVFRGTARQALAYFSEPRGEFTLVVAGCPPSGEGVSALEDPAAVLKALSQRGFPRREALAEAVRRTGLPRRELYRIWLRRAQG